jgi:alpha,alpha-trehalase
MSNNVQKEWSTIGLDALIFDLDGVVTRTASLHMKAWEQMFVPFLEQFRSETGRDVELYRGKEDYLKYIDGIPRYDGVKNLLESRGIQLPYGNPDDEPGKHTISGLGNRKNRIFLELINKDKIHVFEDTITKIKLWRIQGLKTAVISSSKNCRAILKTAEIENLFDVRIDGLDSEQQNIPGKPAPDIFLEAAEQLQTPPSRCAVFEDAVSGIKAGKAGNFKYVIGVARKSSEKELYENGADLVIKNFNELA